MRTIAAYLLAVLGGNSSPKAADIKKILEAVGVDYDDTRANDLITKLQGKSLEEVIAAGNKKLAAAPTAGPAPVAAAPAATTAAPAAKEAPKKVEKKKSESDEDMGLGLFD